MEVVVPADAGVNEEAEIPAPSGTGYYQGQPGYAAPPGYSEGLPGYSTAPEQAWGQDQWQTQAPVPQPVFGHDPVYCNCPFCGHVGMSMIDKTVGSMTWIACCLIFLLMGPCCCIAFMIPNFKDTTHYCVACKQQIAFKAA
ncbi:Oidioi.mRNA.OKI2018_I69.chr1.g657.t1.cds [Oikopleura dioica]|uniref:Oidioi.mRNA.OKI2018_I69.chr1.g657.t1.cds n=1 Tax=Oikopleura dioica TaxID=34765 RepID=A0ABN7SUR2_OIKDI|nr:Oidioi.mRNA.OKI2018_I69.chr1.g657.t1.cds [Oikopleura dioica]